jgi:hypothetical protein
MSNARAIRYRRLALAQWDFSAPLNGVRPGYPAKMSSHQKQETPRAGLSGTHYMTDVENLAASCANPPVAFERPACPRCKGTNSRVMWLPAA